MEKPKDFDPVLSNDPLKEFDVEDPNNQPAFVVFKSGRRIPLEDGDSEPDLIGEAPRYAHYYQRARHYRDSIVFVTLSRYTAEKYCITHRDCFFIRVVNMGEALLFSL